MRKRSKTAIAAFSVLAIIGLCSVVHAEERAYTAERITHFAVHQDGRTFIKWRNSPHGMCGTENYGWVVILTSGDPSDPTSYNALREFAQSLYLNSLPAVIVVNGCVPAGLAEGQVLEVVRTIYSPGP